MAGKSASLLTKTQRQRIRDDFGDLDEEKKRRDQQRIRERIKSGVLDFQVLADYPDSQFEMAFEDLDEAESRAALRDAYLVVERLREVHSYDRSSLIADVRERAAELDDGSGELRSLGNLDIETAAEVREETEAAMRDRYGPNRWDRRASRAMKLAGGSFGAALGLWGVDELAGTNVIYDAAGNGTLALVFLMILMIGGLAVWVLIAAAKSLKYDVVPRCVKLVNDPRAAVADVLDLVRRPGQTLRAVWDGL